MMRCNGDNVVPAPGRAHSLMQRDSSSQPVVGLVKPMWIIIRSAITGKLIDDCRPSDTADATMLRALPSTTSIRVELIMKDAAKWFKQRNADVCEMCSPPRIVQEAGLRLYGGRRLRPGWSLDLTVDDPETGKPWDLSDGKIRSKVVTLINEGKPFM